MSENGWIIQEKSSPDGEWETVWGTASALAEDAVNEWLDRDVIGYFSEWEKWGRVRCVKCVVMTNEEDGGKNE